ncbi:D-isomer specific 2-hydroxyacid dehydrogenase family protein [Pseudooceanicola batsensis HTCC2597]|uniref:D-isomer specific 2-hydroxyacid dehydrogenase family protein n=2 Tax=Pseudooceanicola batsensis TaxID=314255 RepID=A3TTR2_PSEBH|nr:D-isomer specific 2-hydroxyacid dehydrogenase family protein [Pseudooceanicola batsensis HTCC2597]
MPPRTQAAAEDLFEVETRPSNKPMSPGELRAAFAVYDGMMVTLGDQITAGLLADFGRPRCKMVANFGVGYNHIDVAACTSHGVTVSNTPGAVTDATADIAMTLMLMTARRAGEGERLVRARRWEGWHPTQLLGMHLTGKTVGIVGMGRIGQAIARRCHFGFGMDVVFANRSEKTVDFPARQMTLAEVAAKADVVVVATPGGPETEHLIGAEVLEAMQAHAILVNIARGNIVNEAALVAALSTGSIAGAGLDVYEHEPQVTPALLEMEQVTLLPHLGTASQDVREDMGLMAIANLRAYFEGQEVPNRVA